MTLDKFLKSWKGKSIRDWIKEGPLKVYIRITIHYWMSRQVETIDVASIVVEDEEQKKGHFTRLLGRVEQWAGENSRCVYVENVLNPFLASFLRKRGYEEWRRGEWDAPCFLRYP